jgi:hypothetical protein
MRDDVAEPRAVDEHGGRPLLAYHGVLAWSRLRGDEIVVEPYLERITGRGGRRAV